MALIIKDRVQETSNTTGTGTLTLGGAVTGYQSFGSAIGNGNTTYYGIYANGYGDWEVGIGTVTVTGGTTTLARTTVLASSNAGSLVNFSGAQLSVWGDMPAAKGVYADANGNTSWNNEALGYTNYVTSGQTISLTASSTYYQHFSGSSTATLKLPDETTVPVGLAYIIDNDSSANITVQDSGGNLLTTVIPGMAGYIYSLSNSAATGNWAGYIFPPGNNATGTPITWGTSGLNMAGTGIDNAVIGATTPNTGTFTTLGSTGTASLGTASTTYIRAIGDASYPGIYATGGTNTPLVLQPLGTGALQAQATTSSTVGGNARGANAVDWQTSRGANYQVASGSYGVIAGGTSNQNNSFGGFLGSGNGNYVNGSYSAMGGGQYNQVTGALGFVGAGYTNYAQGYFNVVVGGANNTGTSASVVTTQSGTMNGTTAVTLSGSNANIKVGQLITGTSIASTPATYVAAISGTSLTLSQAASGSSTSTLSFYTPHGVVVGGGNNQATGSYSFIGGGGDAGTAANRNVASGDWSFVGGGKNNTASGAGSVVIAGSTYTNNLSNYGSTASADASSVFGGLSNGAGSFGSTVLGGLFNSATGTYAVTIGGNRGNSRGINGNLTLTASNAPITSSSGVSQSSLLVLGRQTTDATATVLTSDPNAASGTNQVILPNNSAYYFKASIISGVTGGGNSKAWTIEGLIKRGANAASTALVGTPVVNIIAADSGASTWTVTATADTTNGGLAITFTGQAGTTIRTVCKVETCEMTY